MPAYSRSSIREFLSSPDSTIIARLTTAYAADGFLSQYTSATVAWAQTLPALRSELSRLLVDLPAAETWQLLLEFPLYRLRRRIDAVLVLPECIVVIEIKTGADTFDSADKRQVIEYAQDLRDFHSASKNATLIPVLWSFEATSEPFCPSEIAATVGVAPLSLVGKHGLAELLMRLGRGSALLSVPTAEARGKAWDEAAYEPVPSVIDAAITLFAGHGVREIALASAKNLNEAADAVFQIIQAARDESKHTVVFLTGVPGAGKTLAGLNIVHNAMDHGFKHEGDVVYLSGNTPLVVVLREALARDQHQRSVGAGKASTLRDARASTRATIQHVNDFLKEYVHGSAAPPSGHVIVFDEAQRAWDARQGKEKFGREASEPLLILETMARHNDWSVTVCLIGLGQEINDGEEGVAGWAEAIQKLSAKERGRWTVSGPHEVFGGERGVQALGDIPEEVSHAQNEQLHLDVPMRSYRSPRFGEWVDALLSGEVSSAKALAEEMDYKLCVTRDLEVARDWLKAEALGERRMGLLASSGARRLRADGIGETLNATDGAAIAHWYLNSPGDIRSSFALEVPANEYTSQGLELDFACLCWGGDLVVRGGKWIVRSLAGNRWNELADSKRKWFALNSYRVLLSRAREGMVIWVPRGAADDHTRRPDELDAVADWLKQAGVAPLCKG